MVVIGLFVLLCILLGYCSTSGSDDCYSTGDPGSAQYDRDVQHCIKQDR